MNNFERFYTFQKQHRRCSEKFRKFHSKTPMLESGFNKIVVSRPTTLLKGDSNTGVFLLKFRNF